MPKYDAFGREIGEDTLEGLGGPPEAPAEPRADDAASRQDAAAPEPAAAPRAAEAPQDAAARDALAAQLHGALGQVATARSAPSAPQAPVARRSTGARGCLLGVLVAGFLVSVALVVLGGVISDSIDSPGTGSNPEGPAAERPAAPPPRGLGPRSLVRRANFAAALARLRGTELRLTNLRVAPERIDAQLLTRGGRLRSLQVRPGGAVERFGGDSGPGFDSTSTIPFGRLDPAAPQRLARAGARRLHLPVARLQYLVPSASDGAVTWAAYFTRGRYVLGNGAGRFQRAYP